MSILKRIQSGENQNASNQVGSSSTSSPSSPMQVRKPLVPPGQSAMDTYQDLKGRVQSKLLSELDPSVDVTEINEVRKTIQNLFDQILVEENFVLSRTEKTRLFDQIVAEILGLGPLQPLLEDDTITEIMVNGAKDIYVERRGKLQRVPLTFESDEHVMRIIERIVAPLGRRIDESSPYVDARLPDGSRVNAVIPPISLIGPILTIRKFSK
ncbi:MAG: ATPase, T2SS/T4P/T4SS family, partial [Anaerolineaceae bacterium]|nr:ATPase, T2SS/T4P/T4SS family [Anaerolineaceae bacterium]